MSGRIPAAIAATAAIAAFVSGVVFGTHVAGGSDSSCYLNGARLLSRGAVAINQPLARIASWKNAPLTFTPAGFRPSPVDPSHLAPICSPGLPLAMATFRALHLSEFLVVPVLGGLSVWLTYIVGRRVDRPLTGAAAALLLVCSPTFLYQVVQPMSDVPATAWWLLATAWSIEREDGSNRPRMAGLAASMALLTRPNLLPLAGVVAVYLFVSRSSPDSGMRCAMRFVIGLIPGVVVLALLQRAMYGSPLATGYGGAGGLMSAANVIPNLRRYVEWLLGAHTPFLLLALAAPAVVRRRRHAWLCLALAGTTLACYLPYLVFDDWWYTRFLLPAIPPLVILSVTVLVTIVERFASIARPSTRVLITVGCVVLVMSVWISIARARHAFDLSEWEQHYYRAGTAVAAHVKGSAAIVTVRNSGSVQYYAGRTTVSWDTLDAGALDETLSFVRDQGYTPYLLFEIDEEPAFRERFRRGSAIGDLDWPPRVQVGRTIRLYDPLDRARFLADGQVRTEFMPEAPVPARDWRRWFR
jgi:hypothetical protein